jgi:hypothetical protein
VCDVAEVCTGTGHACPGDSVKPSTADCQYDKNLCTIEKCDGTGKLCPKQVGTAKDCGDGLVCTVDTCDPPTGVCSHTKKGSTCGQLLASFRSHQTPNQGEIGDLLQLGCFTVDIYVIDTRVGDDQQGVNCAFVDVTLGDSGCPLTVRSASVNGALFPQFQSSYLDPPSSVLNFGGCAKGEDVGDGEWVLLGSIEVTAAKEECTAEISLVQSLFTDSSLVSKGKDDVTWDTSNDGYPDDVTTLCWGSLYNVDAANALIDAGDLSMWGKCWLKSGEIATTGICKGFNVNKDTKVDGGDLNFFASAWQKFECAGGITVPANRLGCPSSTASDSRTTGLVMDEDGNITAVEVPWADRETIEAFGLTVPPMDWAGWRENPDAFQQMYPKAGTRQPSRGVGR